MKYKESYPWPRHVPSNNVCWTSATKPRWRLLQEPQGGRSCAAVNGEPALDSISEDLMEQIVAPPNMERAWNSGES